MRAAYKGARVPKTFRLRKDTVEKLEWLSQITGETQLDIVERIFDEVLDGRVALAEKALGAELVDDLAMIRRVRKAS